MKYLDAAVYVVLMLAALVLFVIGAYLAAVGSMGIAIVFGFLSGLVYSIAKDMGKDLNNDF